MGSVHFVHANAKQEIKVTFPHSGSVQNYDVPPSVSRSRAYPIKSQAVLIMPMAIRDYMQN